MKVTPTAIPDVLVIEPKVFGDDRGYFFESFNRKAFNAAVGMKVDFVQDNHSCSSRNVLRGLHYQIEQPQGKLIRVVAGSVFDVAVDLRQSSPTFGKWVGVVLSEENKKQIWIPPGFAHGFLAMGESNVCLYKTTDYWASQHERCIIWNDKSIGVHWGNFETPQLSDKDKIGRPLENADLFN